MAASEKATRSTTNVWLVGHIVSTMDGPSQQVVLPYVEFFMK